MRSARGLALRMVVALCASAAVLIGATPPAGAEPLPDGRVYELVTPPGNQNADVYVQDSTIVSAKYITEHGIPTELPFEAAADGDAVTYVGGPTSGGNGSAGPGQGNQYLATRSPSGGWTQSALAHLGGNLTFYEAFSSDLSVGVIDQFDEQTPLSPEVTAPRYNVLYARDLEDDVYHPFFTKAPLDRAWYEFYTAGYTAPGGEFPPLLYAGSSANLEHLLFEANDAMSVNPSGGVIPVDGGEEENNLYDSVDGQLQLVNVLPNGSSEPNATFGGPAIHPGSGNESDFSHAISTDGSRVFWTSLEGTERRAVPKALYVRENDTQPQSPLGAEDECLVSSDACTVQMDASTLPGAEKEKAEKGGGGQFWAASSDGSRVLFTDCARLTEDSTAVLHSDCGEQDTDSEHYGGEESLMGNDLYEYDVSTGHLTDLTVDHNGSDPFGADVQGVVAVSEDGEYVYFVADGVLANGATGGQANLYLSHDGATTFIATLSLLDDGWSVDPFGGFKGSGNHGDFQLDMGDRTAQVTPDGHTLVFMSDSSLMGYPNEGLQEVYVYDTEGGGRLSCVSCDPGGAPPPVNNGEVVRGAAGYIPVSDSATYMPRVISEDGSQVFFNSPEPLVSQDTNGVGDVYEWERAGAPGGSCPEGAPNGGCVYLLSGGTSTDDSYLFDASANGDDVFMITRAQLLPQDQDENFKVYDANANGVLPISLPVCSGSGCQGVPAAPPVFATPSSVTFNGIGNFPPAPPPSTVVKPKSKMVKCAKGKHLSHGKCVKSKKRVKKAKRAVRDRRTK